MQTIYPVPHSYQDVAWALSKEDYSETNEDVLRKAGGLLTRHQEYRFSSEQFFAMKVGDRGTGP